MPFSAKCYKAVLSGFGLTSLLQPGSKEQLSAHFLREPMEPRGTESYQVNNAQTAHSVMYIKIRQSYHHRLTYVHVNLQTASGILADFPCLGEHNCKY